MKKLPITKRLFLLVLIAGLVAPFAVARAAQDPTYVRTVNGQIRGQLNDSRQTIEWLGIPYAKPPVGELRWRAPQDPDNWNGTRETTSFSPASMQFGGGRAIGSEDCLYLNVFRPNSDDKNLPVFMFLHGGNNQTGSASAMDGSLMAAGLNAVVITINTRLNALGFLNIDAIKTGDPIEDSGNFGLLDIAKALDWVQYNITAFGGNQNNVTVSGFSSGGRNVLCMTISPLFKDKFHKAIIVCAGQTTTDPQVGAEIATRALASLVVEDGLRATEAQAVEWINSATPEVRAYLMQLSADRFAPLMAAALIRMSVFPHLFADGVVIPREGFDVLSTGNYNKMPMIFTSGSNEFTSFLNRDPHFSNLDLTVNDPQRSREYVFADTYGSLLFGYFNSENNAASYSSVDGQAPVYASRIFWGKDPAIVGQRASMLIGGGHGMDYYLMNEQEPAAYAVSYQIFSAANKPGRDALGKDIRSYFANFLRTGNPNGPGLTQWNPWSNQEGTPKMLMLDADLTRTRISMTSDHTVEEDVFRQLLSDNSLSEDRRSFLVENVLNGRFFSKNLDAFWGK